MPLPTAPVIGMLHAPPLPGSARWRGDRLAVREFVLRDAEALVQGGVQALMLENYGDVPFYPGRVPAETVASLTWLAAAVRDRFDIPLGINVLRNDGRSALAIAQAVGAEFIRVNVLCGARLTDQGILEGIAHDLLRDRARLQSTVQILADVNVKHSSPLANRSLSDEVSDLVHRGCADGLIVTGTGTGRPADLAEFRDVVAAAGNVPVMIGSGVEPATLPSFLPDARGFIVGTWLKEEGRAERPVDSLRVAELMAAWRNAVGSK